MRFRRTSIGGEDCGAYAILYAALVVVCVGLAAVVIDITSLRQDRRNNRAAADSAVVGGAEYLNPLSAVGLRPDQACLRSWEYLGATLGIAKPFPTGTCSSFPSTTAAASSYCLTASPAMIRDERTVGDRTVIVAWPVPRNSSQNFLTPDIAPGNVEQVFNPSADGSDIGCDRLGVAIIERQTFGLAAALGLAKDASSSTHSTAWFNIEGGQQDQVAALNVLNKLDCQALATTGGGKVVVGPTTKDGQVAGPGIIAVESSGNGVCNGNEKTINPTTGQGSLICASNVPLNATGTNCDGLGLVRSHALDPGGQNSYDSAAVSGGNLKPRPTPEGGNFGWNPVTKLFGCEALNPCVPPANGKPNYIDVLYDALNVSGLPTTYYGASQAPPYVDPYADLMAYPWRNAVAQGHAVCPGGNGVSGTPVVVPAGNWYVPCSLDISSSGTVIFKGGNVVVEGGINIASGGCFVVNTDVGTCPTPGSIQFAGTAAATTTPEPARDAIVFIRGRGCGQACGLNHRGKLVLPQTFVFAANSAAELDVNSTELTMWTAPGAGKLDSNGLTKLEDMCVTNKAAFPTTPTKWIISADCMNSRFSRLVYWSEYAAPKTKPNTFAGQGAMSVTGVFFTPTAYFDFTGGSSYAATFAQFWADRLNVNGGAFLGLLPDAKTAIESPSGSINLIR